MRKIQIVAQDANIDMTVTLNDSKMAHELLKILPIDAHAQLWGEEVHFEIPLKMPEEDAHAEVPPGTVAYWSPGHSLCIFFGQEPFSPVNVVGRLDGDPKLFARVRSGDKIRVQLAPKHAKVETGTGEI